MASFGLMRKNPLSYAIPLVLMWSRWSELNRRPDHYEGNLKDVLNIDVKRFMTFVTLNFLAVAKIVAKNARGSTQKDHHIQTEGV